MGRPHNLKTRPAFPPNNRAIKQDGMPGSAVKELCERFGAVPVGKPEMVVMKKGSAVGPTEVPQSTEGESPAE